MADRELLAMTLEVAVPLRIAELARLSPRHRDETIRHWAALAVEAVAHNGDTLMFRSKATKLTEHQLGAGSVRKPGEEISTASTFNHLARGIAAAAWSPGGVSLLGVTWCARHAPMGRAPGAVCEDCVGDPPPVPAPRRPGRVEAVTTTGGVL